MRQHKAAAADNAFSILAVDDDPIMTATVQAYFQRSGYRVDTENDPVRAIERVRGGQYDILLLDFLMSPICGDQVVEEIRQFDRDLYIILLTGHKTMAPPIRTIRTLDIQGYYEKSDRFDQLELLVESCVKSIRQMRTIRRYQGGLLSMLSTLPAIYQLDGISHMADSILSAVSALTHCTGSLLLMERGSAPAAAARFTMCTAGDHPAPPTEEAAALLASLPGKGSLVRGNTVICPLTGPDKVPAGYLSVALSSAPEYEQLQLLELFSQQISAALVNLRLNSLLQEKSDQLTQAYDRLHRSYGEVITTVRDMVDAKDVYTRHHSDRVAFYAVSLAQALGQDEEYCRRLHLAGLFHDIGKLGIPDRILSKPAALTPEEFAVIKTHPARGADLLSALSYFEDLLPWVRAHHERYDGKGYPDGLSGADIPEQARIIAVADAFDAMTSDRQYRAGLALDQALEELRRGAGSQFDPHLAEVFIRLAQTPGFMERAALSIRRTAEIGGISL